MTDAPWTPAAFEARYAADADPWCFESSYDELRRYELLLSHLGSRRFESVLEIGCSIGVLTERLARRATRVVATEVAPSAMTRAAWRLADDDRVAFTFGDLRSECPTGPFDLIVLSEVGYYLSAEELKAAAARLWDERAPGGAIVLAAHWTGVSADHRLSGAQTHAVLRQTWGPPAWSVTYDTFVVDEWAPAPAVERAGGANRHR